MTTTTEDLKENMSATVDAAKKTVGTAGDLALEKASALGAGVSARVSETAATLRDSAAERIEATRGALSDSSDRLAETLRRAAEEPEAGALQTKVLSAAAAGLETVAEDLRSRNFSQMTSDVQSYAQRNPMVFAAGAAVAGFMLARLLRSSAAS